MCLPIGNYLLILFVIDAAWLYKPFCENSRSRVEISTKRVDRRATAKIVNDLTHKKDLCYDLWVLKVAVCFSIHRCLMHCETHNKCNNLNG